MGSQGFPGGTGQQEVREMFLRGSESQRDESKGNRKAERCILGEQGARGSMVPAGQVHLVLSPLDSVFISPLRVVVKEIWRRQREARLSVTSGERHRLPV